MAPYTAVMNQVSSDDLSLPPPSEPISSRSPEYERLWHEVLAAGAAAQQIVPGSIAVGGTAAALYAGHRVSLDTDHLKPGLKEQFDEVLDALSSVPEWRTARIQRPVLILGSINGIQVGFRAPRRTSPIETTVINTPGGSLVIPTLEEMIGIKAFLLYMRNTTRDYLDFAALSTCSTESAVLKALFKLDEQYAGVQTGSVRLEVAKSLAEPAPYDLEQTDLARYKSLLPQWHDWRRVAEISRRYGLLLGERLMREG
jgi:hypothetical protein